MDWGIKELWDEALMVDQQQTELELKGNAREE